MDLTRDQKLAAVVIDLDDTLLRTDLLFEQIIVFLRNNPMQGLLRLALWTVRGRAHLKSKLADSVDLDLATLPLREAVVNLINDEKNKGSKIVLASATHISLVRKIADQTGYFDHVFGTDGGNLKGVKKLEALKGLLAGGPYTYVGDSLADLPLWAESSRAIAVNPSVMTRMALKRKGIAHEILNDGHSLVGSLMKLLRVHQWSKNLLIFVPLVASHKFLSLDAWYPPLLAFAAFSLLASSVYILNDILDLDHDRRHPSKNKRPLASGRLSIKSGIAAFLLLFSLSATAAWLTLPREALAILATYFLLNLAYSTYLKKILLLDVIFLAAFHTMRILMGGAASAVTISQWLLAFSTFFFFGLALVKRYTELERTQTMAPSLHGRGYNIKDMGAIFGLGTASSFLSVVVFVLYLNSQDVVRLYKHPDWLWLTTPILLYWISRTWILASRGQMHDDPVIYAIRDRVSWLVLGLMLTVLWFAI